MQPKCPVITPFVVDPTQLPEYLPIALVSLITGLGVGTIRNLRIKGRFPEPIRFTARKVFWRKADVLEFLSLQGK